MHVLKATFPLQATQSKMKLPVQVLQLCSELGSSKYNAPLKWSFKIVGSSQERFNLSAVLSPAVTSRGNRGFVRAN